MKEKRSKDRPFRDFRRVPAALWLTEHLAVLDQDAPGARDTGANPGREADPWAVPGPQRFLQGLLDWLHADAGSRESGATGGVRRRMQEFLLALEAHPRAAARVASVLRMALGRLHWLRLFATAGLNSRRGLWADLATRIYDRASPPPVDTSDAFSVLRLCFERDDDLRWAASISDDEWLRFFRALLGLDASGASDTQQNEVDAFQATLRSEALYALEMLGIWVAAEELDPGILRVDPRVRDRDSAFVALSREISFFVDERRPRPQASGEAATQRDAQHLDVLFEQCERQIERLRKRSVGSGSTLGLKHLLDRLAQTLVRMRDLVELIEVDDYAEWSRAFGRLLRQVLRAHVERNSLRAPIRENMTLVARSVTESASDHGEHYVSRDRSGYFRMLRAASGAGVVIALMALNKIWLQSLGFPLGVETLFTSLNYGLGFVLIHILHWTVATKQPAMTAAYIAGMVEKGEHDRANLRKLGRLFIDVFRTQSAAIIGNVALAAGVAMLLSLAVLQVFGRPPVDAATGAYLLDALRPFAALALWYAAIAGVWLFVSGLIAGYFDNRAQIIDLEGRVRVHPWLVKVLSPRARARLGAYLGENYGALAGNFFFGVLLGVTGYVGYLTGLPLDIRHVAFASANVGYASLPMELGFFEFAMFLGFALLIGMVNLLVSFSLALRVALRARSVRIGSVWQLVRAFGAEWWRTPLQIVWPPATKPGGAEDASGPHARK